MVDDIALSIEGSAKRITLKSARSELFLRGKSVQFFLALLATDSPRYLATDELHALSDWRLMTVSSVGKQAARIVDSIAKSGFPIIEWEMKTAGWRLISEFRNSIADDLIQLARQSLSDSQWARLFRFSSVDTADVARWMQLCGSALIDMTEGQPEVGYTKLRDASLVSGDEGILAISNVLATRLGQKLPKPHLPVQKSSSASEFLEAAEARRIAAYARTSPSSEWEKQYAILRKTLLKMRAVGDTTSQAIIFNALSVLARRMGHMDEALDCIREAAALAIFSGDLALIQNVAFNFGNILSGIARHDPNSFKSDIFLGLIDLDIELRSSLRIGYDSAQAELLCSYLSYESGDFEGAGARLSQAEPVISVSQQPYDIALYERVKGLLLCDRHKPQDAQFYEGITALEASVTIYTNIGNLVAAEEVSRDLSLRREMLQSRT